jgi:hypothetical protein
VFESDNSYVGRKIILDFSVYADKITIRHVTWSANKALYDKIGVPVFRKPVVYIVKNVQGSVSYENLDSFLASQSNDVEHNLGKL